MHLIRNQTYCNRYRGFESLSLRFNRHSAAEGSAKAVKPPLSEQRRVAVRKSPIYQDWAFDFNMLMLAVLPICSNNTFSQKNVPFGGQTTSFSTITLSKKRAMCSHLLLRNGGSHLFYLIVCLKVTRSPNFPFSLLLKTQLSIRFPAFLLVYAQTTHYYPTNRVVSFLYHHHSGAGFAHSYSQLYKRHCPHHRSQLRATGLPRHRKPRKIQSAFLFGTFQTGGARQTSQQ